MKRLLLVPLLGLAVFLAGRLLLTGDALRLFYRLDVIAIASLATAGCLAAAWSFERGDHLRMAWTLNGISYLFVVLGAAVRIPVPTSEIFVIRSVLALISNVVAIVGMWLFARTYRVAGLELPGSRARKGLIVVGALVLALLGAGHSLYLSIVQAEGGDLESIVSIVSGLGDIITFTLIAPILMTALALRGGLLVWPWSFFVASNVCWLLFDAQDTLTSFVPSVAGRVLEDYTETWRTLACALTLCAALAQRRLSAGQETTE